MTKSYKYAKHNAFTERESRRSANRPVELTIYTDGGCWPNPGPGGWAWVCCETFEEDFGGDPQTTNNRMELQGILAALWHVQQNHPGERVRIYSDSEYAVNGCEIWRHGWKAKGWGKASGQLKNKDLWKQIDEVLGVVSAEFEWVKGHSGNRWNERADELAQEGARLPGSSKKSWGSTSVVRVQEPSIQSIIEAFNARGIRMESIQGKVRVNAPKGVLTDEDRALITAKKVELLAAIPPHKEDREKTLVVASRLAEVQDLWQRGGFTPAYELAVAEIQRLQKLLNERQ